MRIRPDLAPLGGVSLRIHYLSRVGESDIGVKAKRIRAFLADMKKGWTRRRVRNLRPGTCV